MKVKVYEEIFHNLHVGVCSDVQLFPSIYGQTTSMRKFNKQTPFYGRNRKGIKKKLLFL